MLVLTRKTGENILIGDDIEIIVTKADYGSVRLAIVAPREIPIARGERVDEVSRKPFRKSSI